MSSGNNASSSNIDNRNVGDLFKCPTFSSFAWSDCDDLRPVEEIPHPYQQVFSDYPNFNIIQSSVLDDVFYTDVSLVVSAPTGSGKTTIFELAIVRILLAVEKKLIPDSFKIIYICPMKALCEERLVDWHKKLSGFGVNCISVTGDSDNFEISSLLNHNLIITTPEKWDCLTRKWKENIKFVRQIKLFMIDEVHLLNEEVRGSTLETVVCRMKTIENFNLREKGDSYTKIRFIAVSATISNIEDIAEWIGKCANVRYHRFSDEYRPVKLKKYVFGYSCNKNPFKFDMFLNYKLKSLIIEHSHGKPTLIFCNTRKVVEMTAKHLVQNLTVNLSPEQKSRLEAAASSLSDSKIKETLIHGVGFHHAGLLPENRRAIENLFRNNELPILVTTSTLAMGVNLPAHLVIIKSTKTYSNGGFVDYSETALLQMIGRAGRPQFDTNATAIILTTEKDQKKFEMMVGGLEPIESNLHKHLTEHLNAEVVLRTITDLDVAMQWLSSTFLYIRAKKNPHHYGLAGLDKNSKQIDRKLLEMCQIELNKLVKAGMLTMDQNVSLAPTEKGVLMAKYYLAFPTMKLFTQMDGHEILQQVLALISKCDEFSEMYLRVNDKKYLNLLNKCRTGETIRFPLNGKIKTVDMKINCIIQAVLGCLDIGDHSLLSETLKIMRNAERITRCLIEYLQSKENCFQALLSTITLAKCFKAKLWENSHHVCRQLTGIGIVLSSQLVKAGKISFGKVSKCDARDIEMIINKKAPMGNRILDQVNLIPKYNLKIEKGDDGLFSVIISLENGDDLRAKSTVNRNSLMHLIIGDSSNKVLLYEKYAHTYMIENPLVVKIINIKENHGLDSFEAHFISEDWVGFDCSFKFLFKPEESGNNKITKKTETAKKVSNKNNSGMTYMQAFMDIYLKTAKEKIKTVVEDTQNKTLEENKKLETPATKNNVIDDDSPIEIIESEDSSSNAVVNKNPKEIQSKFAFNTKKAPKHHFAPENSEIPLKQLKKDDKTSKISWRSPLTSSPAVKFSPKTQSADTSTSREKRVENYKELIQMNKSSQRTKSTPFFPLSDEDYAKSVLDSVEDKQHTKDLEDIAQVACLESFGLKWQTQYSPAVISKPKNETVTSGYHSWLMSQHLPTVRYPNPKLAEDFQKSTPVQKYSTSQPSLQKEEFNYVRRPVITIKASQNNFEDGLPRNFDDSKKTALGKRSFDNRASFYDDRFATAGQSRYFDHSRKIPITQQQTNRRFDHGNSFCDDCNKIPVVSQKEQINRIFDDRFVKPGAPKNFEESRKAAVGSQREQTNRSFDHGTSFYDDRFVRSGVASRNFEDSKKIPTGSQRDGTLFYDDRFVRAGAASRNFEDSKKPPIGSQKERTNRSFDDGTPLYDDRFVKPAADDSRKTHQTTAAIGSQKQQTDRSFDDGTPFYDDRFVKPAADDSRKTHQTIAAIGSQKQQTDRSFDDGTPFYDDRFVKPAADDSMKTHQTIAAIGSQKQQTNRSFDDGTPFYDDRFVKPAADDSRKTHQTVAAIGSQKQQTDRSFDDGTPFYDDRFVKPAADDSRKTHQTIAAIGSQKQQTDRSFDDGTPFYDDRFVKPAADDSRKTHQTIAAIGSQKQQTDRSFDDGTPFYDDRFVKPAADDSRKTHQTIAAIGSQKQQTNRSFDAGAPFYDDRFEKPGAQRIFDDSRKTHQTIHAIGSQKQQTNRSFDAGTAFYDDRFEKPGAQRIFDDSRKTHQTIHAIGSQKRQTDRSFVAGTPFYDNRFEKPGGQRIFDDSRAAISSPRGQTNRSINVGTSSYDNSFVNPGSSRNFDNSIDSQKERTNRNFDDGTSFYDENIVKSGTLRNSDDSRKTHQTYDNSRASRNFDASKKIPIGSQKEQTMRNFDDRTSFYDDDFVKSGAPRNLDDSKKRYQAVAPNRNFDDNYDFCCGKVSLSYIPKNENMNQLGYEFYRMQDNTRSFDVDDVRPCTPLLFSGLEHQSSEEDLLERTPEQDLFNPKQNTTNMRHLNESQLILEDVGRRCNNDRSLESTTDTNRSFSCLLEPKRQIFNRRPFQEINQRARIEDNYYDFQRRRPVSERNVGNFSRHDNPREDDQKRLLNLTPHPYYSQDRLQRTPNKNVFPPYEMVITDSPLNLSRQENELNMSREEIDSYYQAYRKMKENDAPHDQRSANLSQQFNRERAYSQPHDCEYHYDNQSEKNFVIHKFFAEMPQENQERSYYR